MRWRLFRLSALYVASVSALIVIAMNPVRTAAVVRRGARLAVHAVRSVVDSGAGTTIAAAPEPVVPPVSAQSKRRAVARADHYRVPIGTVVSVQLRTAIDSSVNHVNDQVDAVLVDAVTQDGVELIPAGSVLHGSILSVEAASRVTPLGQVSFAFAVVQHAETHSRAEFVTRSLSVEAQAPAEVAGKRRGARGQPIDVSLPAGHRFHVTLAQPLVVAIPRIP